MRSILLHGFDPEVSVKLQWSPASFLQQGLQDWIHCPQDLPKMNYTGPGLKMI